jgi:hypothetical protein
MDNGDPTTVGFNKFERVLDNAVNKFYEENARGDAAIVNVDNDSDNDVIVNVDDNSDAPPQLAQSALWEQEKIPSPYGRRHAQMFDGAVAWLFSLFGWYISITL